MSSDSIEFTTVREDWTVLRLANGSLYKLRVSLGTVLPRGNPKERSGEFNSLVTIEPVEEDKGQPTEKQEPEEADLLDDVPFEIVSNPVNIYEVADGTILIARPIVNRVQKTDLFDKNGHRIFQSNVTIGVVAVPIPRMPEKKDHDDSEKGV